MRFYVNGKEQKNYDMFLDAVANVFNEALEAYASSNKNVKPKESKENKKSIVKVESKKVKTPTPSEGIYYSKRNETKFTPLYMPRIREVMFNNPATICWFEDNSKTVAVAGHGDKYDKETGLAICMLKRVLGNKEYRRIMDKCCYHNVNKENLN